MASPADTDGQLLETTTLIEYDLPHQVQDDTTEIMQRIERDKDFGETLVNNHEVGYPFLHRMNQFFHHILTPKEWHWNNTPKYAQEIIFQGLTNHGRIAIMQKERLRRNVSFIESYEERSRVLTECDDKLVYAWYLLNAFSIFDDGINSLCMEVKATWDEDVDLDSMVVHVVESHGSAEKSRYVFDENVFPNIVEADGVDSNSGGA